MAKRKCYGYEVGSDGELTLNPEEAKVVSWIFERYLAGDSLGKIAARLEKQGTPSPTGRPKWNRKAIDKLLSNEKYTGRVLRQKTVNCNNKNLGSVLMGNVTEIPPSQDTRPITLRHL